MGYDFAAATLAFLLAIFASSAPAAAIAVSHSDDDAGLSFIPPALAWPLAVIALVAAFAILVFASVLDGKIDHWLLSPSSTAMLRNEVNELADARAGGGYVGADRTTPHRTRPARQRAAATRLAAMTIGLAPTKIDKDPSAARALISEAHEDAKSALLELRNVVRGIAPTILADRGLDAALSAVAQRAQNTGVPTTLNIDLPRRLPEEIESVAYFVVAGAPGIVLITEVR